MSFQVDWSRQQSTSVVLAIGELDLATVEILEAAIEQALDEGTKRLVIDLTGVTFMDSTGIRALLVASQRFEEAEGSMNVVLLSGPVARALEVTGVDRLLKLFDTVTAATA